MAVIIDDRFWKCKRNIFILVVILLLHIPTIKCPPSVSPSDVDSNSIFYNNLVVHQQQQQAAPSLVQSPSLHTSTLRVTHADHIINPTLSHPSVQSVVDASIHIRNADAFDESSVYSLSIAPKNKDGVETAQGVNSLKTEAIATRESTNKVLTSTVSHQLHPSPLHVGHSTVASTIFQGSSRYLSSSVANKANSTNCTLSTTLRYFYASSFLHANCSTEGNFTKSSSSMVAMKSNSLLLHSTPSINDHPSSLSHGNVTKKNQSRSSAKLCSHWSAVETSSTVYVMVCPTRVQSYSSILATPSPCFKLINISSVLTKYSHVVCSKASKTIAKVNVTQTNKNNTGNVKTQTTIKITDSHGLDHLTSACSSKYLTTITHQKNVSCGYSITWSTPLLTNNATRAVERVVATLSTNATLHTCRGGVNASGCVLAINASNVYKPPDYSASIAVNQNNTKYVKIEYEYLEEDRGKERIYFD